MGVVFWLQVTPLLSLLQWIFQSDESMNSWGRNCRSLPISEELPIPSDSPRRPKHRIFLWKNGEMSTFWMLMLKAIKLLMCSALQHLRLGSLQKALADVQARLARITHCHGWQCCWPNGKMMGSTFVDKIQCLSIAGNTTIGMCILVIP